MPLPCNHRYRRLCAPLLIFTVFLVLPLVRTAPSDDLDNSWFDGGPVPEWFRSISDTVTDAPRRAPPRPEPLPSATADSAAEPSPSTEDFSRNRFAFAAPVYEPSPESSPLQYPSQQPAEDRNAQYRPPNPPLRNPAPETFPSQAFVSL